MRSEKHGSSHPAATGRAVAWMTADGRVASDETKRNSMSQPSREAFCIPLGVINTVEHRLDTPDASAEPVAHTDDDAVDHFAVAMKDKLAQARAKGRHGWHECPPEDLSAMLRAHVEKGDPRDVANFCCFLWSLGKPISAAPVAQEPVATTGRTHSLKTDPEVFQAVFEGRKTFEIRVNDRGFRVGDELLLKETTRTGAEIKDGAPLEYTGRTCRRAVSHILTGYGLAENWCCLSFAAPIAAQAQPDVQTLIAYAEGRIKHVNEGECPDNIEGHDTRDPDCPVCRALMGTIHAQPAMPPLTEAMRAVLRNENDIYGSEDAMYAALCDAAQAQPSASLTPDMQRESQRGAESAQDREDAVVLTSEFSKGYEIGLRQRTSQDREDAAYQRDVAIGMLAHWVVAIEKNGTGWDDWDEHFKNARFRDTPIRKLLDEAIDAARAAKWE